MIEAPRTAPTHEPTRLHERVWPHDHQGRRFTLGVGVAMALGFAIRIAFVVGKQSQRELTTGDAFWYHYQAKLIARGDGFLDPFQFFRDGQIAPGAQHPPGFILFLSLLDALGIDTPQGQRVVMCAVGTISILVIALLARRIGGVNVGILAAMLAAVYPNIWINDAMLLAETGFVLSIAVALLFCYRYLDDQRRADLLVVALALSVSALHRPESLLMFAALVLPMVIMRRTLSWRERLTHLALGALVPVLLFAPWVAFNLSRFEQPVIISTGAGQTLIAANCEHTYSGYSVGYYDFRCVEEATELLTDGDSSLFDAEYQRIAIDYMSEHRAELPRVMALRVGRLWHLFRPEQSMNLDGWIEGRSGGEADGDRRAVGAALLSYYLLVPLAVGGAVLVRRRGVALWPLLMSPLVATAAAALTFGITRYRAGAEITLVVLAAVAIDWLGRRLRRPPFSTQRS